jgi:hypothetical protein
MFPKSILLLMIISILAQGVVAEPCENYVVNGEFEDSFELYYPETTENTFGKTDLWLMNIRDEIDIANVIQEEEENNVLEIVSYDDETSRIFMYTAVPKYASNVRVSAWVKSGEMDQKEFNPKIIVESISYWDDRGTMITEENVQISQDNPSGDWKLLEGDLALSPGIEYLKITLATTSTNAEFTELGLAYIDNLKITIDCEEDPERGPNQVDCESDSECETGYSCNTEQYNFCVKDFSMNLHEPCVKRNQCESVLCKDYTCQQCNQDGDCLSSLYYCNLGNCELDQKKINFFQMEDKTLTEMNSFDCYDCFSDEQCSGESCVEGRCIVNEEVLQKKGVVTENLQQVNFAPGKTEGFVSRTLEALKTIITFKE